MKLFKILASLLIISGITFIAHSAQDFRGAMLELRESILSYRAENIHPEMLNWKAMLDENMTKEDLAKVNEMRERAHDIREKKRSMMMERRTERMKNRSEEKSKRKQKKQGNKNKVWNAISPEMKTLISEAKPYIEKYKDILNKIEVLSEEKRNEWKSDIEKIHDQWKDNNAALIDKMDGNRTRKRRDHRMHMKNMMQKEMNDIKGGLFLLWDGTLPQPPTPPQPDK